MITLQHIMTVAAHLNRGRLAVVPAAHHAARVLLECRHAMDEAKTAGAMANELGSRIDMPCPCCCERWKGRLA